jgi:hypothetical protein
MSIGHVLSIDLLRSTADSLTRTMARLFSVSGTTIVKQIRPPSSCPALIGLFDEGPEPKRTEHLLSASVTSTFVHSKGPFCRNRCQVQNSEFLDDKVL